MPGVTMHMYDFTQILTCIIILAIISFKDQKLFTKTHGKNRAAVVLLIIASIVASTCIIYYVGNWLVSGYKSSLFKKIIFFLFGFLVLINIVASCQKGINKLIGDSEVGDTPQDEQ